MKITATEEENDVQGAQTAADLAEAKKKKEARRSAERDKGDSEPSAPRVLTPKKLECSPEQKEKVVKSITAYVQSAKVEASQGAKPAAPAAPAGSDAPKSTPAAPQRRLRLPEHPIDTFRHSRVTEAHAKRCRGRA